jgi:protein phosphatase
VSNRFSYLTSAELTDVGRRRKNNEDSLLSLPENGVFCVADGMGGVQGGEVASKAAVDALRDVFTASPDAPFAVTVESSARLVVRALNQASQWIRARSEERGMLGTGSTAVVLIFDCVTPSQAMILHAGDSRAYRYRADKLVQLSVDHSVAAAAGLPDDKTLPAMFRGVITRAVGLENTVQLEQTPTDVMAGDLFLLCSDGLDKMVSDKLLHKLLRKHRDDTVPAVARVLIDEALKAGGEDNVSVVLVRVAAELPKGPTMEVPPQTLLLEQEPIGAAVAVAPAAGQADDRETGQTVETGKTFDSARFEGEGVTPVEMTRVTRQTPNTPATPVSRGGVTPSTQPKASAQPEETEEKKTQNALPPAPAAKVSRVGLLLLALLVVAGGAAIWFFWLKK